MSEFIFKDLSNKNVLVTGGASGIGRAIVEAYLAQGCHVGFIDFDKESAESLISSCPESKLFFEACDLTDLSNVEKALANIKAHLGEIHVVVNNAASDKRHTFTDVDPVMWDQLVNVNLRHQYFVTQYLLDDLKKNKGAVINLSSISWRRGVSGLPVYVTCKAGVEGLTRALARELGPDGIRVNAILPGMVLTEKQLSLWLTQADLDEGLSNQCLKYHIYPDDIANAALYLSSTISKGISSQILVVDGGWI